MRFLMTTTAGDPPDEKMMTDMGKFVEELTRDGVLLATGGLDPAGTRITAADGRVTLTDGPFAEAKEAIISFALVDVRSRDEAIELAKRFWQIARNGAGAIQQVYGPE
ncbi:MAG: YciI family protein [Streptosporangiaceae bacterium]